MGRRQPTFAPAADAGGPFVPGDAPVGSEETATGSRAIDKRFLLHRTLQVAHLHSMHADAFERVL
jgi:hypothetical protein